MSASEAAGEARATVEGLANPGSYGAIHAAKRASRGSSFPPTYKANKRWDGGGDGIGAGQRIIFVSKNNRLTWRQPFACNQPFFLPAPFQQGCPILNLPTDCIFAALPEHCFLPLHLTCSPRLPASPPAPLPRKALSCTSPLRLLTLPPLILAAPQDPILPGGPAEPDHVWILLCPRRRPAAAWL